MEKLSQYLSTSLNLFIFYQAGNKTKMENIQNLKTLKIYSTGDIAFTNKEQPDQCK